MFLIVKCCESVEFCLHLLGTGEGTTFVIVKNEKRHTKVGMIAWCAPREENGQKLCCKTMAVSLCSAARSGPRRLWYSAIKSRESARSRNMWSPMLNSGS